MMNVKPYPIYVFVITKVRNYRLERGAESINSDFGTNKATPSPASCQPVCTWL